MADNTTAPEFASSSSAASSASTHFDVFINHRGPDAKNTIAAYLYRRLTSHGLRVFLDRPALEAGKRIFPQIKAAIKVASVHIAIFSEDYASSKWCLDELRLMVDSEKLGATILPVFYKVEPALLRLNPDSKYAEALRELEGKRKRNDKDKPRYDPQRIQGWRNALFEVADISGLDLKECNGDEAELLERIVQRVLKKVPEPELHVAKYATGLGEKIGDFEKTVLSEKEEQPVEAKVVGITGLGGIGKTTLANEFFNRKRSHYDGSCFLADVREKASRLFLPSLQEKLIEDLKGIKVKIDRWEQGIGILKKHLRSLRVLIIIDDVDDADQLDAFLPIKEKGVLHPKSLILVTSRDKKVLKHAKASIYQLEGLNESHSQELFCSHAFFQPHPRPGFEDLVVKFVKSCDGLPLSLKVFGALLCGEDQPYWEEKLKKLHELPDKILASLEISYNSLKQEEQKIFLDIACFALGEDRDKWVRIWGGFTELQTLEHRCLVEVVDVCGVKTMRMHDHLRDMGRNIAEKGGPRRLWRSVEDVHDLLESSVIPDVRGIRMLTRWPYQIITEEEALLLLNKISSEPAIEMRTLQLLESDGKFVEGILRRMRSPNLAWLRWYNCPCSSLPNWIPMGRLKVLEVKGTKLKKLWRRDSQAPLKLRELYVDAPLLKFPKSIGKLKDLEKIVLSRPSQDILALYEFYLCSLEFSTVPTLPEEFFHLRSLKYLELHGHFRILPKEFGNLTNLQRIVLNGCERLENLPDSFTNLTNLQVLKLSPCNDLKRLPNSLGDLTNLREITLDRCRSLEVLPHSFANLTNLQKVYLSGCIGLKQLPNSFGDLTNLQGITFEDCEGLEVLPESFGSLTNLLRIGLTGCKKLKKLPDSFTDLKSLQHLMLSGSDTLKRLPKSLGCLTNLEYINLSYCKNLKKLPNSLGDLTDLQEINLDKCESLEALPDSFGKLKNLQRISLQDCGGLMTLPNSFGHLKNLESIDLTANKSLKMLPDNFFGNLINLETVDLSGFESLAKLPHSLGNLTKLRSIKLDNCKSLKKLPKSLGELTNLRSIDLSGCKSLRKLPKSLGELTNLLSIDLSGCKSLKKLPNSLGNLSQLRCLDLSHCSTSFPRTLGNITTLEFLDLSGCVQMEALPVEVEHQKSLALLNLVGTHLKELPNAQTACLSKLEYLFLGSPLLKELPPSFGCLFSELKVLLLHGCQELKRLPDSFGLLTQLTELEISKCGIQELPGLMEMNNLETLRVRSCPLRELPFKESSAPRRKRKRRATDKGLIELTELELYCTEVREVSFPQGVCSNLYELNIMYCNDLVKVGSLPETITFLNLRGCGALRKIKGLSGLANPEEVDMRGCCNIEMGEMPHFRNSTHFFMPTDTYNQEEDYEKMRLEENMAALQEGVLPDSFAVTVNDTKQQLALEEEWL